MLLLSKTKLPRGKLHPIVSARFEEQISADPVANGVGRCNNDSRWLVAARGYTFCHLSAYRKPQRPIAREKGERGSFVRGPSFWNRIKHQPLQVYPLKRRQIPSTRVQSPALMFPRWMDAASFEDEQCLPRGTLFESLQGVGRMWVSLLGSILR